MAATFLVRGHGIQLDEKTPIPIPYDIKKDLLAGSDLDPRVINYLVRAYINKMAPTRSGNLIDWFNMSSSQLLTTALACVELNESKNRLASKTLQIKPISDPEVKARIMDIAADEGFISPKAWEERFPRRWRAPK